MFCQSLLFCLASYALFHKRKWRCKIGAYRNRAGLNLGAVKMRVEKGKKVFCIIPLYSSTILSSLYLDRGCCIIVKNSSTYTSVGIGL
jgi:hypothetical protein